MRDVIEFGLKQLSIVLESLLVKQGAKHLKIAEALNHAEFALQTLNAKLSFDYGKLLLTDSDITELKKVVSVAMSQAINRKTYTLMYSDASSRRYLISSILIRSLSLRFLERQREHVVFKAHSLNKPVQVKERDKQYLVELSSSPVATLQNLSRKFVLYPLKEIEFFV